MADAKLNPNQRRAIQHGNGPLLIVAGAGTGKTTVITRRIQHLIVDKKIPSEKILALTFTEKAAFEMQERVDILLPYGYTDMWIHTFHGFCDRVLQEDAHMIGLNRDYKLISKAESLLLLQDNIYDLGLKDLRPRSNPVKFLDDLLTHFSRLKDEDITPIAYQVWVEKQNESDEKQMYKELASAYRVYEQLKVKHSFMDFADLISNTLHLFRSRKQILKKYQKRFDYILVDEFQDTNYAQNELAILLSEENKNLTVVADDDQSIYRFRGAAVSNVLQFKKTFPDAATIPLTQNYRSTQAVLDSSYRLIQHNNPDRLEVIEHIDKKLKSSIPDNNKKIEIIHEMSALTEADAITKRVEQLLQEGYTYKDIAILVRANNHALPIAASLSRKKFPYQFLGPEYLFQQEEIKDLIAYVLFLSDITDSVSLFRVLSMDVFDISGKELNLLTNFAKKNDKTLFEVLQEQLSFLSNESKDALSHFSEMATKHLEASKKQKGWNILYDFLIETRLIESLNIRNVMSVEEEKRVQNITKFFERIKHFEQDRVDSTIYTLASWLKLLLQMGDSPKGAEDSGQENAINIATIHGVKGLEFRVVFLVNLVSQRFPSIDRSDKFPLPQELLKEHISEGADFHLQEERRLFYVGMTRAKELLIFTAAHFYGEGKRPKKLSPFVFEALPDHREEKSTEGIKKLPMDSLFEYKQIAQQKIQKQPLKIHSITYSNIQMFDICPLHYKAKVIFNIPTRKTSYQNFGIILHKTLQEFYERAVAQEKVNEQTLLSILDEQWNHEGFENKRDEKEQFEYAKNVLRDFYKTYFNPKKLPVKLEYPFSFKLKNGVSVSGAIDRIDKTENGIEVIDYKTGKHRGSAKKMYHLQLAIYALAATRVKDALLNQQPENITVTLHFLEDNTQESLIFTKKDLEQLEDTLIGKVEEIETSDFACSKSPLCTSCEYAMLCVSTPTIH